MVAKRSAASGNAVPAAKPRSRKVATSAAAVVPVPAWGKAASEPEVGVGLDGSTVAGDVAAVPEHAAAPEPKTRRGGRQANAGHTPAHDTSAGSAINMSAMQTDLFKNVERIERINEEIDVLKEDVKEFFEELKSKGYKVPIVRKMITRRAMDPDKRRENDDLLSLYEDALKTGVGNEDE